MLSTNTIFCSKPQQIKPFTKIYQDIIFTSLLFKREYWHTSLFAQENITPIEAIPKRQAEYFAGRFCAKSALLQLTKSTVHLSNSILKKTPDWPENITGSITHSNSLALAACTYNQHWKSIGIDAEPIVYFNSACRLAHKILTLNEQAYIKELSLNEQQFSAIITLHFSLKESLFKALHPLVKKQFYFKDAEILPYTLHSFEQQNNVQIQLASSLSKTWEKGTKVIGEFCYHQDHLLSLVTI